MLSRISSGLFFAGILFIFSVPVQPVYGASYVGSEACFKCHAGQYNDFIRSGHPLVLQKVSNVPIYGVPLPEGYYWEDISYIVGGVKKKAIYLDVDGYVISAKPDGTDIGGQYNLQNGAWTHFARGERKSYDCGSCHTTGYKVEGHQDGKEGIAGTWAMPGVHCESCHGPGSDHIKDGDKKKIVLDRGVDMCGKCHSNGPKDKVASSADYILYHSQQNEIQAGGHRDLTCVSCHNPHLPAELSIVKTCRSCHRDQEKAYRNNKMYTIGVKCIDCHMAKAVKSANLQGKFAYDTRSHLFRINPDVNAAMFYEETDRQGNKNTYARGFLSIDYACLGCHTDKDPYWASFKSKGIH